MLIATTLPSRATGLHNPEDPYTFVVDLYIQAVEASTGTPLPLPEGTEIEVISAVVGELGIVNSAVGLVSPSDVKIPDDFPQSFFTSATSDGLAFEDGSRLNMLYRNDDRSEIGYEPSNHKYQLKGGEGQDTVRITAFEEEFHVSTSDSHTTYTYRP